MADQAEAAARCAALKARYPRINDPVEAINFALSRGWTESGMDFLDTWRDGAWDEIEVAYPEFLQHVAPGK